GINSRSINTNGIKYSGYKLLGEARYYLDRNQLGRLTGFYFGLYVKYSDFNSDIFGVFTNEEGDSFTIDFDAGINVTSLGFLIGYKLPLGKRFSVDFLIAGPGSGHYDLSIKNNSDELPDSFYEDLNEALEEYGIFDALDGNFQFAREREATQFTTLSFRYAIKFGFSF
ncbi:MAG: DUF3575 domain-containing protein, partial [Bacteroidota bacterium]